MEQGRERAEGQAGKAPSTAAAAAAAEIEKLVVCSTTPESGLPGGKLAPAAVLGLSFTKPLVCRSAGLAAGFRGFRGGGGGGGGGVRLPRRKAPMRPTG